MYQTRLIPSAQDSAGTRLLRPLPSWGLHSVGLRGVRQTGEQKVQEINKAKCRGGAGLVMQRVSWCRGSGGTAEARKAFSLSPQDEPGAASQELGEETRQRDQSRGKEAGNKHGRERLGAGLQGQVDHILETGSP